MTKIMTKIRKVNRYICYFNRNMTLDKFKAYSNGNKITDYSQLKITRGSGIFNGYFYLYATSYEGATQVLDSYMWNVAVTIRPTNRISKHFFNAVRGDNRHVTCKNGTHAYLFTSGDGDSCEAFTIVRESSSLSNKYDISLPEVRGFLQMRCGKFGLV